MSGYSFSVWAEMEIPDTRVVTRKWQNAEHRAKTVRLEIEFRSDREHAYVGLSGKTQRMKADGSDTGHLPASSSYDVWKWITIEEFEALEVQVLQKASDFLTPGAYIEVDASLLAFKTSYWEQVMSE